MKKNKIVNVRFWGGLRILMVLAIFGCSETNSPGNNAGGGDKINPDKGETPPPMRERVGKIHYAASTPCQAGDYSDYPHGVKSVTIECGHDGKLSKIINFSTVLWPVINYNTPPKKYSEVFYRASGVIERHTLFYGNVNKSMETLYSTEGNAVSNTGFYQNGNKSTETLYSTEGNRVSYTSFYENGNKHWVHSYRADGTLRKQVWFDTDGMVERTWFYDAEGVGCDPLTTKCVGTDPD